MNRRTRRYEGQKNTTTSQIVAIFLRLSRLTSIDGPFLSSATISHITHSSSTPVHALHYMWYLDFEIDPPVDGESGNQEPQQQSSVQRTTSNPTYLAWLTRENEAPNGLTITSLPDTGPTVLRKPRYRQHLLPHCLYYMDLQPFSQKMNPTKTRNNKPNKSTILWTGKGLNLCANRY